MNLNVPAGLMGCLLLVPCGLAAPDGPPARTSDEAANPYAVIGDRNIFHLNPIPIPPQEDQVKKDLPVIKLSGFLEIGTKVRALFCSSPKQPKEEPAYYNLAEGEKSDMLEVVKIHYKEGLVDIINSGTPMTLSLKDDSLATKERVAASIASHPAQPGGFGGRKAGGPPSMPGGFPAHAGKASDFPPGGGANGSFPMPARTRRIPLS
jgi:hypothetical protein